MLVYKPIINIKGTLRAMRSGERITMPKGINGNSLYNAASMLKREGAGCYSVTYDRTNGTYNVSRQ